MAIEPDEPAFPTAAHDRGMTERDYVAVHIMQALIASGNLAVAADAPAAASLAYAVTDALIAESAKPGQTG